jgi:hypothetical protein
MFRSWVKSWGWRKLSAAESWENECCRCGSEVKETLNPGKRACHITCGPCLYPDNPRCASCEIVGHCSLALDYLKNLRPNGIKKGCFFNEQLGGEETLYHALNFVNSHQHLVNMLGEDKYLGFLKKANAKSPCLENSQGSQGQVRWRKPHSVHRN